MIAIHVNGDSLIRLPLTIGAYSARSIIASAQRAVNIYSEANPKDAPVPFSYYPTAGLRLLATPSPAGPARGLYRTTTGALFYVVGTTVYSVSTAWGLTSLGSLTYATSQVSMADNGTTAIVVDGTTNGYQIDLTTLTMTPITEAANNPGVPNTYAFYGSTRADIQDGYIVLNAPGTRNFYTSYLNQFKFDALYFAAKNGYSDILVAAVVQKRQIFLIGQKTTEIWANVGAADFPFAIQPGPFITHGCLAPYSIAVAEGAIYWLSQDLNGQNILARAHGYEAKRVSTFAIETEWSTYATTADAIGFCFQQNGHVFYQINFPTADKTWRYDESTEQWHEALWTDTNGIQHRHRANCTAFANGLNVVGDWETGKLYALDPYHYSDNGQPMEWRRGFPHLLSDGNRVIYPGFTLDMEAGAAAGYTSSPPERCTYPVIISSPTVLATVGALAEWPATSSAFVFSVWLEMPDDAGAHGIIFSNQADNSLGTTNGGVFIQIANDETLTPQITVKAWSALNVALVSATYPFAYWDTWVNVLISLDTSTQELQVYANTLIGADLVETPLIATTLTWGVAGLLSNLAGYPWRLLPVIV